MKCSLFYTGSFWILCHQHVWNIWDSSEFITVPRHLFFEVAFGNWDHIAVVLKVKCFHNLAWHRISAAQRQNLQILYTLCSILFSLKGAFVDVQFTHAVSTNEALYYLKLWLSWSLWIIGLMIVLLSHRKTMILRQRAWGTNIYVYEVILKNKIIVSTCFSQIRALEFHVCEWTRQTAGLGTSGTQHTDWLEEIFWYSWVKTV